MIQAKPGMCQECALLPPGFGGYIPCGKPAVAIVGWHRRPDEPIRMCMMCLAHNVKNRGGEIRRYVEDWSTEEHQTL